MTAKDARFYPEGRERVYLSPAHMDIHGGRCGFFVETLMGTPSLGFYDRTQGRETAVAIDEDMAATFKRLAQKNAKTFGEVCANPACRKAMGF